MKRKKVKSVFCFLILIPLFLPLLTFIGAGGEMSSGTQEKRVKNFGAIRQRVES
jgi:hypothetical protein